MRKHPSAGVMGRTYGIQVRVGNTDNRSHGRSAIRSNTVCGDTLPAKPNVFRYTSYICSKGLSGRYLTAQTMVKNMMMELSDIDVFTASKCYPFYLSRG